MKQDWKSLPPALQHQLIIQMGLAVCCLVLAIGALAFISFSVSVPFLLGAALLTICAARLYRTGMRGQYLILRGVILKVERTVLHGEKWFTIFLITASRVFGIGTVFPFLMMILSA